MYLLFLLCPPFQTLFYLTSIPTPAALLLNGLGCECIKHLFRPPAHRQPYQLVVKTSCADVHTSQQTGNTRHLLLHCAYSEVRVRGILERAVVRQLILDHA